MHWVVGAAGGDGLLGIGHAMLHWTDPRAQLLSTNSPCLLNEIQIQREATRLWQQSSG